MGRVNRIQGAIQNAIAEGFKTPEDISNRTNMSVEKVTSYLNSLEKAGVVDKQPDGRYFFSVRIFGEIDTKTPPAWHKLRPVLPLLRDLCILGTIATLQAFGWNALILGGIAVCAIAAVQNLIS